MMNDNIVTRLREALQNSSSQLWEIDVCKAIDEAINEIEYLQNEIAEQTSEYNKLWTKYNALMRDIKYPLTMDFTYDE